MSEIPALQAMPNKDPVSELQAGFEAFFDGFSRVFGGFMVVFERFEAI